MGLSQDTTWAYHYPRVVREDPAVRKPLKSRLASLVSAFITVLVTCLLSIWMQSDCLCLGACAVNVHPAAIKAFGPQQDVIVPGAISGDAGMAGATDKVDVVMHLCAHFRGTRNPAPRSVVRDRKEYLDIKIAIACMRQHGEWHHVCSAN